MSEEVEQVLNSQFSPNIVIIKSLRINWSWHVAHTEKMRNSHNILIGKHGGTIHLSAQGCIYGRTMFKQLL
jgi:hypothetical protein